MGVYPKKIEIRFLKRYPYLLFTAALFPIAKIWKLIISKCPLTNKRIKEMWYTHVMEYYLSLKKEGAE